jgi:hypothetical protein
VRSGVVRGPPDGVVDRAAHADLTTRGDLLAEQIAGEVRVWLSYHGRVVAPRVMAFSEKRDRVNVPCLQGLPKPLPVESFSYPGDMFRSMKVEMYLAGW